MKRLGVCIIFLLGWDASPILQVDLTALNLKASISIHLSREKGTLKGKCLAQEHSTVIPARVEPKLNVESSVLITMSMQIKRWTTNFG